LFERADIYLPESDIFIDAKNFSERSIDTYRQSEGENSWTNKNSFIDKAFTHLSHIQKIRPKAKLILINVHCGSNFEPSFLDRHRNEVKLGGNWCVGFVPNLIELVEGRWVFSFQMNSVLGIIKT